jgi:hypothetical protein
MQPSLPTIAAAAAAIAAMPVSAAPEVIASGSVELDFQPIAGSQGPSLLADNAFLEIGPFDFNANSPQAGRLDVLDGGNVRVGQTGLASGLLNVSGFGSAYRTDSLGIFSGGISITDGGLLLTNDLNTGNGSSSVITVDGFGSLLQSNFGPNLATDNETSVTQVEILNGGQFRGANIRLGQGFNNQNGTAIVSVSGIGSRLSNVGNDLQIGPTSTLTLADGGVAAARMEVRGGSLVLDKGRITPDSNTNQGVLITQGGTMAGDGVVQSQLDLDFGSTLRVGENQRLQFDRDNAAHRIDGEALVDGGALNFAGAGVSINGMVVLEAGTLEADDLALSGSVTVVGGETSELRSDFITAFANPDGPAALRVAEESTLRVSGFFTNNDTVDARPGSRVTFLDTVSGAGSYVGGGDFVFLGTFSPGNSPAVVEMAGDVTLDNAALEIELFGTGLGEFDRLEIDGIATLGGALDIVLGGGFVPQIGDRFDFLDASGLVGGFDYDPLDLGSGRSLDLVVTGGVASLIVVPEPATAGSIALGTLVALRRRRA